MSADSYIKKTKKRFTDNFKNSPIAKWISIISFWIFRLKTWKKTRPRQMNQNYRNYFRKIGRTWAILEYERVTKTELSPIPINDFRLVHPDTFEMQCEILKKECNVISLIELTEYLENKEEPPPGTVVITISNGHADAFKNATKALTKHKLHASWSIPVAYMESQALLLEDMISTSIHLFHQNDIPFPKLDSFSEQEWKLISSKLDKDGRVSTQLISLLYTFIIARKHELRHRTLNELEVHIKKFPITIPEYYDFMKWDEVFALHDAGFTILPGIFTHSPITDLDNKGITQEIQQAKNAFDSMRLKWHDIIGLPLNMYEENSLDSLSKNNIKWCLGGQLAPHPYLQESATIVLPRVSILQCETFSRDMFLSKIWKIT